MLHATEKVINLATDSNRLVSLVTSSIGDGPHNVVLPLQRFDPAPSPDTSEVSFDQRLIVDGYRVDLLEAERWDPSPDWIAIRKHKERIHQAVPRVLEVLRTRTPDPGVLCLFDDNRVASMQLDDHFIDAIKEPALHLISGLANGSGVPAMEAALKLAGLGTGLTPAGDDLIAGAMLACWAGCCPEHTLETLPQMARQVATHTTRLSAAYIQAAAVGEFGIVWHQLLKALTQEHEEDIRELLESIVSIGHNSGAYTLAGFILLVAESAAAK